MKECSLRRWGYDEDRLACERGVDPTILDSRDTGPTAEERWRVMLLCKIANFG